MYKDANGNLVLKGTYSDTSPSQEFNKGRNCCEKEALTTHVFRNLKPLPLFAQGFLKSLMPRMSILGTVQIITLAQVGKDAHLDFLTL